MALIDGSSTYRIVVFDLGGVLAQIWHTWEGAARQAGVRTRFPEGGATPLISFPPLDEYQMRAIDLETYLDRLSDWTGCPRDDAMRLHNGILIEEYPGVYDLVTDLQSQGVLTGCLSNTNAPHWDVLASSQYPAIHKLERKMASHLVGLNKPDPAIFELYALVNEIRPCEIIFFDDHAGNVASAREVGFEAIKIDPSGDTAKQMREHLSRLLDLRSET